MKRFILGLTLISSVYATEYSKMSTDELMSLRGRVPMEEREALRTAVQSRVLNMSADEKATYGVGVPKKVMAKDGSGSGSQTKAINKSSKTGANSSTIGVKKQKGRNR